MMIKVGDEYLEGYVEPHLVRQAKKFDTLEDTGDFSYRFTVDDTAYNRGVLGIKELSSIGTLYPEASIDSNGVPIHLGNIRIEEIENGIQCSFFSGNNNWFSLLSGKVYDIDLSEFKIPLVNTSPSATLIDTWDNTEGIIYPLLDRGRLVDLANRRLDTGDFLAMTYIKNIVAGIFKHNGLKFAGDLFGDGLYNITVIGTGNPYGISFPFQDGMSAYPGKTALQSISSTPVLVTFPVVTYPFHNGKWQPWDISNSRYTASQDVDLKILVDMNFTGPINYTLELRVNGSEIETIAGSDSQASAGFNEGNAIRLDAGDYFEVWAYVDAGTPSIINGSLKIDVLRLPYVFPQYLLADMTQAQVIQSVFLMFNVIASYDPYTKTVTCNLFRNLEVKEEQDLSMYLSSYTIDFIELTSDIAQHNYFKYQESLSGMAEDYRQLYDLDFGDGDLRVQNQGLRLESSFESEFTASFDYYNTRFGANLMHLGIDSYESIGEAINIISVTNDGGDALFTTDEDHGLQPLDFVRLSNMINGVFHGLGYEGLSRVSSVPSTTTFKLQFIDFTSAGTGDLFAVNRTIGRPNNVFVATVIPDYAVSNFSINNTINYSGTSYSEIAYAYFLRPNGGFEVDDMRESIAFGKPFGFTNLTLLEKNYRTNQDMFNNPMMVRAIMNIPEEVYRDLDFSRPVRLRTSDFDGKFVINKDEGYLGSHMPCEMELIKIY